MKFWQYIGDAFGKIVVYVFMSLAIIAVLGIGQINFGTIFFIGILLLLFGALLVTYDYARKKSFYDEMQYILNKIDKKYLLAEMLERPRFLEGKIFWQVLYETDKAMNERINFHVRSALEFRDYIEMWVHEVKAPLMSLNLVLHGSDKRAKSYTKNIEDYIEQALFYAKISDIKKDYVIKNVNLGSVVKEVVKRNKDILIAENIKIEVKDLDRETRSDPKWLQFILNQIILNSIKYQARTITIFCTKNPTKNPNNTLTLYIKDDGIGIKASEIERIFDKGFTGENDRRKRSSTGMGLYIADTLSKDLGHKLTAESEEGKWTSIGISFGEQDILKP